MNERRPAAATDGSPAARDLVRLYADATQSTTPREREGFVVAAEVVARHAPRRRSRWMWASFGLLVPAAALALVLLPPRLTYTIDGAPGAHEGPAALRTAERPLAVAFSEGSHVELFEQSAGRIADLGRRGAHLVLERGRVQARVTARPGARWSVDAGPFRIAVAGTRFEAAWQPDSERLEVMLHDGSVLVTGPMTGDGIRLTSGLRLRVDARTGAVELDEPSRRGQATVVTPAAHIEEAPAVAEPRGTPPHRERLRRSARADAAIVAPERWPTVLERGDFDSVVGAAESMGLSRAYRTAPAPALRALADAARFSHRPVVARAALSALRQRFPGGIAAADAAFFLGWLADEAGSSDEAIEWYDLHLRAARSTYAEQALGRKMLIMDKRSGASAARSVALEYLRLHPTGTYAEAARRIRGTR